jgi:predicted small lipoprotein YifL
MINRVYTTLMILTLLLVSGCGQMGALYMPTEDTVTTPSGEAPIESEPAEQPQDSTAGDGDGDA